MSLPDCADGTYTLVLKPVEPAIVFEKIVVDYGGYEDSYLFMNESPCRSTLVMMVCRNGEYFVPQGKTELLLGDKLLVISDRSEELATTYKDMGIDDVMKLG